MCAGRPAQRSRSPPPARAMIARYTSTMTHCDQAWARRKPAPPCRANRITARSAGVSRPAPGRCASGGAWTRSPPARRPGRIPRRFRSLANRRARFPESCAHRRAMHHSPLPSASIQPTGPAYRSRSIETPARGSPRRRHRSAYRRRRPSGAPRRRARARTAPGPPGVPRTRVPRCWTLGSRISSGRGAHVHGRAQRRQGVAQRDGGVLVLLVLLRRPEHHAGEGAVLEACVAPRGTVPARTSELTSQPSLPMSSSGVAPTMPSQAKV